jgi:hypothetical protein
VSGLEGRLLDSLATLATGVRAFSPVFFVDAAGLGPAIDGADVPVG